MMGTNMPTKLMVTFAIIILLAACGGSENVSIQTANTISISGAAQKGPFIVGTPVFVNKLDEFGNAGESTIITEIEDSVGSYSFNVNSSGPVRIISTGYYFSELTGQISSGTLTLKAIYNASNENDQVAYVNILTHLISDRVLELIKSGEVELNDAISQAQLELISALSEVLPVDSVPNFNALRVYNTNVENEIGNAYLLALSAAFYKYAETKAYGENTSADAQLSLILNQIANDFAGDGLIQQTGFIDDLTSALRKLNPNTIAENLRQRSSLDFSEPLDIPDITRFFWLCAGAADCMWSSAAPMPAPTRSHATAVYQNKIYVFGGATPDAYTNEYDFEPVSMAYTGVYEYEPESNQWSQKQPMPIGMYVLTAHTIGDKIYIFGGYGPNGFLNSVMAFDPVNNSWAQKTARPTYRYVFMSEEVNGKVYLIGGQGMIDDGPWEEGEPWEFKSHVEIYDPQLDSWSNGASAPSNVAEAASCALNDEIYILGGYTGNYESNTYVYNVTTDMWMARSPASIARTRHACVSVGNEFFVIGGFNDGFPQLDAIELYSTEMDRWEDATTFLPTARYDLSADAIGEKIYIMGGQVTGDVLNVVEVLDTSMIAK